jgi:hypothetical protein
MHINKYVDAYRNMMSLTNMTGEETPNENQGNG